MELLIVIAIVFGAYVKIARDLDAKQDKIDEEYFNYKGYHIHPRHKVRR